MLIHMFFTEYLVHTRYLLAFLEKKTLYGSYFKQLLGILGRILNECRQIKEKEKISEMKIMFLPRGRRIWYKLTGVLLQRVHMDDWNGFKAWDQLLLVWQKKNGNPSLILWIFEDTRAADDLGLFLSKHHQSKVNPLSQRKMRETEMVW